MPTKHLTLRETLQERTCRNCIAVRQKAVALERERERERELRSSADHNGGHCPA